MTSHAGIFLACLAALTAASASARAEQEIPRELRGIEIEDRLGAALPLHTAVVDERGAAVTLGEYFKAKRPVILVLNYYSCPTLCSLVLNKLVDGLRGLDFTVGREFEVVALSIDPNEKPPLASSKRAAYLTSLDRPVTPTGWPFLTATADAIASVASAVGFRFRYDAETKQYAHAAGIFVLTPDGRLSRTLYGLMYPTRDLRLALIEAGKGSIGSPIDRLLMFCYHYDPENRRYLISPMTVMRIGGSLAAVFLAMFLLSAWRKERRASVSG
jgi:protein SCO1/2